VRASTSTSSKRRKYLLLSMTSASPVVWPHWLVPAPRARIGTRSSRAIPMVAAMSLSVLGTTTPIGAIW